MPLEHETAQGLRFDSFAGDYDTCNATGLDESRRFAEAKQAAVVAIAEAEGTSS